MKNLWDLKVLGVYATKIRYRSEIAIAKIMRKAAATVVVLPFEVVILFSPILSFCWMKTSF
jgi:hypothetical protein